MIITLISVASETVVYCNKYLWFYVYRYRGLSGLLPSSPWWWWWCW